MIHGGEIYDKKIVEDLSVNLNPYPAPASVKKALDRALQDIDKYPDITQRRFKMKVSEAENHIWGGNYITDENVIGGNGASELFMAVANYLKPSRVLMPVPCFYGYFHALNAVENVELQKYYLKKENDFELKEDFLDEITDKTDLIILANPNNPTGKCIDDQILEKLISKCIETDTAIIIDECFLNLSTKGTSAVKYIGSFPKLYIINAYTKLFSIPGVRVGYCISDKDNISNLRKYLPEWNMSIFAQYAGEACAEALIDTDFLHKSKELIVKKRKSLTEELRNEGIRVFDSDTCFLLVYSNEDLYDKYLGEKILIRDCSNFAGLAGGYYRLAINGRK